MLPRATNVVRLLTDSKGKDPQRLTASGKGEFNLVATNSTPEGRAKNRRTEIILSPTLDELMEHQARADVRSSTTRPNRRGRVLAAVFGGYLFVWGFCTLVIGVLVKSGVAYGEAREGVMLVAFLVFLCVFCWAFAARRLIQVYAILFGGGALMSALAWRLAATLN